MGPFYNPDDRFPYPFLYLRPLLDGASPYIDHYTPWVPAKVMDMVSDNHRFSFEHWFSCMNLFIANYFCAIVYLQIACGMDHTLLLSDEGEVFTCGWGADGQTG